MKYFLFRKGRKKIERKESMESLRCERVKLVKSLSCMHLELSSVIFYTLTLLCMIIVIGLSISFLLKLVELKKLFGCVFTLLGSRMKAVESSAVEERIEVYLGVFFESKSLMISI